MGGRDTLKWGGLPSNRIRRDHERKPKLRASTPSYRRWKCKRCARTWRSEIARTCPFCHGPQEEIK